MRSDESVDVVRHAARWFESGPEGVAPIVEAIGDASVVLIGEASHGTDEFYRIRADLTSALVQHKGFTIVAAEADWPDAYRLNRWVRGASDDPDAVAALGDFTRFPRWMWRNDPVVEFVTWLHRHNADRPPSARTGFYGLDLYSLHTSIEAVLGYLRKVDPEGAARARQRYACFDHFQTDSQAYGYAATVGLSRSCEDDVVRQLIELRRRAADYANRDGRIAADDYFYAEQNARLVRNAEQYYRSMFGGRVESWNLRDTHMMETLTALVERVAGEGRPARAAVLIGFTTHIGTVTAARDWDAPVEQRRVRPSLEGSVERLFHTTGIERFFVDLREEPVRSALTPSRLERAIGVIYVPETERASHYFRAHVARQFDLVIHVDDTHALNPLERWARIEPDVAETYPTGM